MHYCSSLESVSFPEVMPILKKIGGHWMAECPKLKHVDFSGFVALKKVGKRSLSDYIKKLQLADPS